MKKYRVIEDLQGDEWCVGIVDTAKGWLDRAIGWRDSDDSFEDAAERKKFIAYWEHKIKMGEEEKLIEYVADVWAINFEEVKE